MTSESPSPSDPGPPLENYSLGITVDPAGPGGSVAVSQVWASPICVVVQLAPAREKDSSSSRKKKETGEVEEEVEQILGRVRLLAREHGLFMPVLGVAQFERPTPKAPDDRDFDAPAVWWVKDATPARELVKELLAPAPPTLPWTPKSEAELKEELLRLPWKDPGVRSWVEKLLGFPPPVVRATP